MADVNHSISSFDKQIVVRLSVSSVELGTV